MNDSASILKSISSTFTSLYSGKPDLIARAPGRVNLIGEHTDYNDGFVLPMAINRSIWLAARPRPDRLVRIYSLDFENEYSFSLDRIRRESLSPIEYVKGVAHFLQIEGRTLTGFDGVMKGNVPVGAGLSSSAALEMVSARIFCAVSGLPWKPAAMAELGQQAENEWVGMNCGIMDQLISALGEEGQALLIDCRTLETKQSPLPRNTRVVVMDTGTRRGDFGLMDSAYNERRAQCENAARILQVNALRDLTLDSLDADREKLDKKTYRRAHHVVSENQRTLEAYTAMIKDNPVTLGKLMNQSHQSLQADFEVSSKELDLMAEIARNQPGCFGARMTGGGFAGCAVALIKSPQAEKFCSEVETNYRRETGLNPILYLCRPSRGASLLDMDML